MKNRSAGVEDDFVSYELYAWIAVHLLLAFCADIDVRCLTEAFTFLMG